MNQNNELHLNNLPTIPLQITIGVTGHRRLGNIDILRQTIQEVLDKILAKYPGTERMNVRLYVLSPLAEGADRLVVEEIFKRDKEAVLKAVLPLHRSDYLKDFQTEESREEFNRLLGRAKHPLFLRDNPLEHEYPPEMLKEARRQAYEDVGRYVVNHCDVLIALWNGKTTRRKGGTAEIIKYAKDKKCPVYIIDTNNPSEFRFVKN